MKLIALIFLFAQQVFSSNGPVPGCEIKLQIAQVDDLEAIQKHLEWHGASNGQIQNASCKSVMAPTDAEMKKFILSKTTDSKQAYSVDVNGVNFKNESQIMIDLFNKLTTAKDAFGIGYRDVNQKNFQKDFNINPECNKVECAVTKIWGEKLGRKIIYLFLKHGFNSSEYAFEYSDRLKDEEMDDVLMSVEDLPKQLIPLGVNNQRLTHFSFGRKLQNQDDNTAANSVIMLFDVWSRVSRLDRQYTIFHELAHNMSNRLGSIDLSPTWLNFSGWIKKGDTWSKNEKSCMASKYSQKKPEEDFAEAVSAYRYNPGEFKKRCPEKYQFIKENVFSGIEYNTFQDCLDKPQAQLSNAVAYLSKEIEGELIKMTIGKNAIIENCNSFLTTYPLVNDFNAKCANQIFNEKVKNIDPKKKMNALALLGDSNEESKMPILLAALKEGVISKGISAELNSQMNFMIAKSTKELMGEIVASALPQKTNSTTGLESIRIDQAFLMANCRQFSWQGKEFLKKCLTDYIINDDRKRAIDGGRAIANAINFPLAFNSDSKDALREEYYILLRRRFLETDLLNPILENFKIDIQMQMQDYFQSVGANFFKEKDWKSMDASSFCKKIYNSPDEFRKKDLFGAEEIPGFRGWCEKKQNEKGKRIKFTQAELDEWLNSQI